MTAARLNADIVAWREVEDEIVIIDLRNSEYFTVNSSAAILWRALDEGTSEEDLVALLRRTYDVSESDLTHDVRALLADLRHRGLLEDS